jgi:hypothetical protein
MIDSRYAAPVTSRSAVGGRPRALAIASGLWLALGILWTLGGLASFTVLIYGPVDDPIMYFMPPLIVLFGVVFMLLARKLGRGRGRGRDTRIPLAILGVGLTLFWVIFALAVFWFLAVPLVLWVGAAVVLQFLPDSGAWLKSAR